MSTHVASLVVLVMLVLFLSGVSCAMFVGAVDLALPTELDVGWRVTNPYFMSRWGERDLHPLPFTDRALLDRDVLDGFEVWSVVTAELPDVPVRIDLNQEQATLLYRPALALVGDAPSVSLHQRSSSNMVVSTMASMPSLTGVESSC
jgi:hypothetical protein